MALSCAFSLTAVKITAKTAVKTTATVAQIIATISLLSAASALAQDTSQLLLQQSQQAAIDANLQASQATQQAMADSQRLSEQINRDATSSASLLPRATPPSFSEKAGAYGQPLTVRLTDRSRGVTIYYTTDGWTPSTNSPRYVGPITIRTTTTLQAIAIGHGVGRSRVSVALYTLPTMAAATGHAKIAPPALAPSTPAGVVLRGTTVPLRITTPLDSETARIGDPVAMELAQDLVAGGTTLAPQGTPALGRVLAVEKTGRGGLPGSLTVEVLSLSLPSGPVRLQAIVTREGRDETRKANGVSILPLGSLFVRGQPAAIPSGARLTATVSSDTSPLAALAQPGH